jgi:hypothetical protein
MPRYSLRTLLILMAIGPPALAGAWSQYRSLQMRREFNELRLHWNNEPPIVPVSDEDWRRLCEKRQRIRCK